MATIVTQVSYTVTVVGGSFQYGAFKVADATSGAVLGNYPGHFALSAAGAPVNPSTEDTQLLLLAAINALLAVFQGGLALDAGKA